MRRPGLPVTLGPGLFCRGYSQPPSPAPRGILSLGVSCELRGLEGQGEGGEGRWRGRVSQVEAH